SRDHRRHCGSHIASPRLLYAAERHSVDLVLRCELRIHDFRWRLDCILEGAGLSKRAVLHVWPEIGSGAPTRMLPLGFARLSIRCRPVAMFATVETVTWANIPAAGKAGIAPPFAIERHWPGLPEPGR